MMRKKAMRTLFLVGLLAVMISMCSMTAFAAGDVAGAIGTSPKSKYRSPAPSTCCGFMMKAASRPIFPAVICPVWI